uniref:CX domain-containing protein n=1 Tax=Rhabditophanes sp. KR3021 TaxID=114890 RepID=A0AC35TYX5_9BILA
MSTSNCLYLTVVLLCIITIGASVFAFLHNNWYTIATINHPLGLFGGCFKNQSTIQVNELMNTHTSTILHPFDFCNSYKTNKPHWMKRVFLFTFVVLTCKIMLASLHVTKHICFHRSHRGWGSISTVMFAITIVLKFFNLCVISQGRKQIYVFYRFSIKSTCLNLCRTHYDDGMPHFGLGSSFYLEAMSLGCCLLAFFIFFGYLSNRRKHSIANHCFYDVCDNPRNNLMYTPTNDEFGR